MSELANKLREMWINTEEAFIPETINKFAGYIEQNYVKKEWYSEVTTYFDGILESLEFILPSERGNVKIAPRRIFDEIKRLKEVEKKFEKNRGVLNACEVSLEFMRKYLDMPKASFEQCIAEIKRLKEDEVIRKNMDNICKEAIKNGIVTCTHDLWGANPQLKECKHEWTEMNIFEDCVCNKCGLYKEGKRIAEIQPKTLPEQLEIKGVAGNEEAANIEELAKKVNEIIDYLKEVNCGRK